MDTDEILAALSDSGDTFDLPDGRRLRLTIDWEQMDWDMFYEPECYGRIEWVRNDATYGRPYRPDGFDGGARILRPYRCDPMWWQPPKGDYKTTDEDGLARYVTQLLDEGFAYMTVELEERCSHGEWHTVDVASLGGIPVPDLDNDADRRYLLSELVSEVTHAMAVTA